MAFIVVCCFVCLGVLRFVVELHWSAPSGLLYGGGLFVLIYILCAACFYWLLVWYTAFVVWFSLLEVFLLLKLGVWYSATIWLTLLAILLAYCLCVSDCCFLVVGWLVLCYVIWVCSCFAFVICLCFSLLVLRFLFAWLLIFLDCLGFAVDLCLLFLFEFDSLVCG